ncbi:MAG: protein arginine kinase [Firmicutes bacterium]|nr:protein arginine kinase [Bacillota bacterium]
MIWYKESKDDDIIISTRIRLARNLEKYPFPETISASLKDKVTEEVKSAVLDSNSTLSKEFKFIKMSDLKPYEREELAERHLISNEMKKSNDGGVFLSNDENMSIMLMEEDHIRLQVILGGAKLKKAWELANRIDDVLEENLTYAFSEKFGYLTACPTNTGTGMRASVMMHLPALTLTGNINKIISSASALGLTVRGLYGEGSKAYGNLYQISNQITLGVSEEEIIEKLENISSQIEKHEKESREAIKNNDSVSDKLWRSYGTLKFARNISSSEAKALISDVILGENMGIIDIKGKKSKIELMIESEPALIMQGKNLTPEERDKKRADFLRTNL